LASHLELSFNPAIGLRPLLTFFACSTNARAFVFQSRNRAEASSDRLCTSYTVQTSQYFNPAIGLRPLLT